MQRRVGRILRGLERGTLRSDVGNAMIAALRLQLQLEERLDVEKRLAGYVTEIAAMRERLRKLQRRQEVRAAGASAA